MISSLVVSLLLTSRPANTICNNWAVGATDHSYEGQPASHTCVCATVTYAGAPCLECTPANDGGIAGTCLLRESPPGCTAVPSLPLLLGALTLLLTNRRRAR